MRFNKGDRVRVNRLCGTVVDPQPRVVAHLGPKPRIEIVWDVKTNRDAEWEPGTEPVMVVEEGLRTA